MKSALYDHYTKKVIPALKEQFGYGNVMQVPRCVKVVVNAGYGRHVKEKGFIDAVEKTLSLITGQKPVHNAAKKSISNFKIRQGMNIGASVTLRGERMYQFLYRLINLTLPRVRDFRGLDPKAFDGRGNYTIGFKEHLAFPEVSAESVDHIHGFAVNIVTTAKTPKEGLALLKELGFPFKQK